jgi:hypothetical protein
MADCWEPHRERIRGYFIQAGMKLEEVMWHMEKYHGFSARFVILTLLRLGLTPR